MNATVRLPDPFGTAAAVGQQRDPFEPRYDEACYFDEAVRAKRLNLLFHLIPYSDVLLVTGEAGSGKTAVLLRLLAGANDSWRICRLQATAEIDGAQLFDILTRDFSLRPDAGEDADQRLRRLRESLYSLRHSALVPVLVIDDAHLLTHSALAMLAALTEPWESKDKLLSVVMFAEPEISKRLIAPGLEGLRARINHTFDIPPLSEEDTGKYVRHRLQAVGVSDAGPFTDSVIKFIHVASRGFPGRINEFARVVLHNSEQKMARHAVPASLGSRTKVYFKYGIAAVLASAAAVGLLYQDRLLELVGRGQRPATAPAEGMPPAAVALAPTGDAASPSAEMPATAGAPLPMDTSASSAQGLESTDQPESAPAMAGGTATSAEAEASVAPVVTEQAETAIPVEPASEVETAVVAPLPGPASGLPEAGQSLPDAAGLEAVMPAPTVTSSAPRDDDWLLAQDPDAYTLQLLVANRAQCLAYMERHGLGDAAALYQTRTSGQVWYSLVYGVYATEVDAADAGKAISEQDVNAKPWVRKMAMVQSRIREFRTSNISTAPPTSAHNKGVPTPPGDIRRESWLLEQSPEVYTLQLFSGKEANVTAYLKRHSLSDQVALYQPTGGIGRLTVTYGIYSTRTEASQAAKDLATRLPDIKPWVRPLREIQAIITPAQGAVTPASAPFPPQANQ
jgi:septal ring-binding cell division protein DamX/type II secretory pathway predicted ATPase ExeA